MNVYKLTWEEQKGIRTRKNVAFYSSRASAEKMVEHLKNTIALLSYEITEGLSVQDVTR